MSLASRDANDERENGSGRTSQMVADEFGIPRSTYIRSKKIIEQGSDKVRKKLRSLRRPGIFKEYTKIRIEEKKKLLKDEAQKVEVPEDCKVYHGDFMELGKNIPDNSVDLVLTDPPYGGEFLYLFEPMAKFVNRVLKEGGSLVLFAGQYDLLAKGNIIEKSGLKFRWQICVKHTGNKAKMMGFGTWIKVAWKPLIWFIKGNGGKTEIPGWIEDFVESQKPPKDKHKWAQSTIEAEHVIKGLTVENQIVCDPFMGYATNGVAALKLGRKFIGIEIDKEHFSNALDRLSKYR